MTRLRRVGILGISLTLVLFAACGGKVVVDTPSAAGGGGNGGTGGSIIVTSTATGTTTTVTTGTTTTTTGVGGAGGGPGCWQAPDCFQCCVDQDPFAYEQFVTIVVKHCACGNPMLKCFGPCSDPNQNACQDPLNLGEACVDCLNDVLGNNDPCGPSSQMTCMADPTCAPLFDCFNTCP